MKRKKEDKSSSKTPHKKTRRGNPKHIIPTGDGRNDWLELVILYMTMKRGGNEWYSEEDLIDAANGYEYGGKYHVGPYSTASGFVNERKAAVTKAIEELIRTGHLKERMIKNGSGIEKVHYARNMDNTPDMGLHTLDTQSSFGSSSTGIDTTKELRRFKDEKERRKSLLGVIGDSVGQYLGRPDESPYRFHGGKRKSKKSKTKKNRSR